MRRSALAAIMAGALVGAMAMAGATAGAADWDWALPAHFPEPAVPADNPMSAAKVTLGRHLFYDRRLSGNGTLACAGCHLQALAFTDGRARSPGATGEATQRNAPGLANAAWNATFNWANPALTALEQQIVIPLFAEHPVEMGLTDANRGEILDRLGREPVYPPLFGAAFPDDGQPLTMANTIKALAAFVRAIVSADSRFDRHLQGRAAFTAAEQRGMELFFGEKAECHHCHGSFNFNDQVVRRNSRLLELAFHNNGLYDVDGRGAYPARDRGLFDQTGRPEDMGGFRAPSLRNVALTAPYMHDGSVATLAAVIDQYARGGRLTEAGPDRGDGRLNPHRSSLIGSIALDDQDKHDLLAFLAALTDETLPSDPRLADPWPAQPER